MPKQTRRAFTIIELLVVVSIIMLLIAILLPSFSRARYNAKSTVCGTQKKQVCHGLAAYAADFKGYYPARWVEAKTHNLPFWWSANNLKYDMHLVAERYFGGGLDGMPETLVCFINPDAVWGRDLKKEWPLVNIYRTNVDVWAGWHWTNAATSAVSSRLLPDEAMPLSMRDGGLRPLVGDMIENMTGDSILGYSGWVNGHQYDERYHVRSPFNPQEPMPDPMPYGMSDGSVIFTREVEAVYRDDGWGTKYWAALGAY